MTNRWIVLLVCLACWGCRRPAENHDIEVWLVPDGSGVTIKVAAMPMTLKDLDRVLQQVSHEYNDVGLVICVVSGVGVSHAGAILALAEKYGITKVVVKLDRPPPPRSNSERTVRQRARRVSIHPEGRDPLGEDFAVHLVGV